MRMRKLAFIGSHLGGIDEKTFLFSVTFRDRLPRIQFSAETEKAYFLNSQKAGEKEASTYRHWESNLEHLILNAFTQPPDHRSASRNVLNFVIINSASLLWICNPASSKPQNEN